MSYIHCSYCGQRGHNRLSCPERKRDAAANPEGYQARSLRREEERRQRAVESRVCSYCKQPGHNRRSCKILKEDKQNVLRAQREYAQQFTKELTETGITPGALIEVANGPRHDMMPNAAAPDYAATWSKSTLLMLESVTWENVDFSLKAWNNPRNVYHVTNKTLFRARVVAAVGDWSEHSDSYWDPAPSPQDRREMRWDELAHLFSSNLISEAVAEGTQYHSKRVKVVSPTSGIAVEIPDEYYSSITPSLSKSYGFTKSYGYGSSSEERRGPNIALWKISDPSYYEESEL